MDRYDVQILNQVMSHNSNVKRVTYSNLYQMNLLFVIRIDVMNVIL